MLNHKKPFVIPLLVVGVVFLIGLVVIVPKFAPTVGAQSPLVGSLRAYPDKTPNDAVGRALLTAQSYGLWEKADAIYIKRDTFKEFEQPNESWPIWDNRTVWAIRLDKRFNLRGKGMIAQSSPVDHLVVFIDEQTGEFAGVRAGIDLPSKLQNIDWIPVQESEIGNFSVGNADMPPEYYSMGVKSLPDASKTATPPKQ